MFSHPLASCQFAGEAKTPLRMAYTALWRAGRASRPFRRSVRQEVVARAEFARFHSRCNGSAGRMASRSRAPQHLGVDAPRGVLEICCEAPAYPRKTRIVRAAGKQLLPAPHGWAWSRQRGGMEDGRQYSGGRTSKVTRGYCNNLCAIQSSIAYDPRRCRARSLSCRPDPPAPAALPATIAVTSL